jgi:ankyrin repeat protein
MQRALAIFSFILCSLLIAPVSFSQSSQFLEAIRQNDIDRVQSLLRISGIDEADEDSANVLHYAALYASADCMKLLLQNRADPNAANKLGETPLMWCSHDLEKTKLLLNYKADVNAKTKAGNTPLLIACVGQDQNEMIRLLLDKGADPLAKNERNGTTLLRLAQYGDTAIARILINKGVNINAANKELETALQIAVRSVNKPMVHWLLANGADANFMDSYKAPPLYYAVVINDVDMVKALIKKTKNINLQDIDGMTSLMWAVYNEDDNPENVQALLDAGARLDLKDKNGATALTWALKKGNTKTVALLKKAGAK